MAGSLNKVFLMGNLTRDPELRYVPSGTAVATFSVAVNRTYKDKAGEKKDEATFVRVEAWGKTAEICGEYLKKGSAVLVEGRLKSSSWEGQDGQKRSSLDVVAVSVQFVGARATGGQGAAPRPQSETAGANMGDVASIDVDREVGGEEIPF
ncbi:MAG: single-stranded DNA-binding protein [Candidatus Tantalella remota]|nr:single-stranded DNA-binding protein [Candidatus Tantalella remota]